MVYNRKVDFHSHYLSKTYYEYLNRFEGEKPDDFPTPKWSPESHLALMNKLGIGFAFLSVSSPNLSKADKETEIFMVRKINEEGAEIVKSHVDKFGLFANLPLPHVEESVSEAKYDINVLHADGFGLSTNYSGLYLGDPSLDPLMRFFDSVKAVIAVHPVKPAALPKGVNGEIPIPAMEFLTETTRTFTNMVLHNIFGRYPNIRWIFPHGGAFLTTLSDRMSGFSMQFKSELAKGNPFDFKNDMRHVYFDVAGFSAQKQLHDLLLDVSDRNLLYGSDAPYTPTIACVAQTGSLEASDEIEQSQKENMFTCNAVRLVPRIGKYLNIKADGKTVCYSENPMTVREKFNRGLRNTISKIYGIIFS